MCSWTSLLPPAAILGFSEHSTFPVDPLRCQRFESTQQASPLLQQASSAQCCKLKPGPAAASTETRWPSKRAGSGTAGHGRQSTGRSVLSRAVWIQAQTVLTVSEVQAFSAPRTVARIRSTWLSAADMNFLVKLFVWLVLKCNQRIPLFHLKWVVLSYLHTELIELKTVLLKTINPVSLPFSICKPEATLIILLLGPFA